MEHKCYLHRVHDTESISSRADLYSSSLLKHCNLRSMRAGSSSRSTASCLACKNKIYLLEKNARRWNEQARTQRKVTHIFPTHLSIEIIKQGPLSFADLTVDNRLGDSILQGFRYHANIWGHIRSNPPEMCIRVTIIRRSWRVCSSGISRSRRICSSGISSSSLVNFLWELAEELHSQICWLHINQP